MASNTSSCMTAMSGVMSQVLMLLSIIITTSAYKKIPNFQDLKTHYPGYAHYGGRYHNHNVIESIGCSTSLLLHDTSALRMSMALNKIGGDHSLGRELIRLSKFGRDSVSGRDGMQYMYHPIAYGPYLAEKYGYPNVSRLHDQDPVHTKKTFWGKQGILRVITYTKDNTPKGHVALWDCNHFHQSKDWIAGHSLISVEFWASPDSDCSHAPSSPSPAQDDPIARMLSRLLPKGRQGRLRHKHWEKKLLHKFLHRELPAHRSRPAQTGSRLLRNLV